jgi:hypothetical protein
VVARIRSTTGLVVEFHRDGEMHDQDTAPTSERALKLAIVMIARLDGLQDGDRLTVSEAK